jgi:hypothetical protein
MYWKIQSNTTIQDVYRTDKVFVGWKLNVLTYTKEHGNSTAETCLGVLQLSKLHMNGGSNRHNYRAYKIENMLPIHKVLNGYQLPSN